MAINAFFAVMGLVFAFVSIKIGHDISAVNTADRVYRINGAA